MSQFAHGEVRRHNGVPTLFVDGRPLHGMTATSTAFAHPDVIQDFVRSGVEIMMIWIEIGIKCFKGPGQYDWRYAEQILTNFEQHAGDTKWIIRVRMGLQQLWWNEAFPAEVHQMAKSMATCNIASPVWRDQCCQMLRDFVAWLKTTRWAPRIFGFMLNAGSSEEWLIWDAAETTRGIYHEVYVREMRNWLRRRYENDESRLRQAWNDPAIAFDRAGPPTDGLIRKGSHIFGPYSLRDPKTERQAIDYYRFLNETLADNLIAICRATKEAAGAPIVVGGFHSYLWWESGVYSYIQEYGHGYIQRLVESPWIDFVSDITSYDNRYPGGPSGYLGLPHTLNLNNKLHYTEVDLVTHNSLPEGYRQAWQQLDSGSVPLRTAKPAIPDRAWQWKLNYCGRDPGEQAALFQREHLHNLVTGTPYWWFDIRGRDYQGEKNVATLARLSQIGKAAVGWDRRSISEVAFVLSEDTPMFQSQMNGELLRFELEHAHPLLIDLSTRGWGSAGVPFDRYELHDLVHPDFPGEQYKLMVFVNCAHISAKAAEGIRRWQNDGRVFAWTFAAGVIDDQTLDAALNEELIGMHLGWRYQRQQIHVLVDGPAHPLTTGGRACDFGTEGSVGPVFFVDDPNATPLGHLRDGGEVAYAVRDHGGWKSVYLSMLNFGPAILRNLTRFARGHVYCDSNDVVYANRSLLCLHSASGGAKSIRLPAPARVTDLWQNEVIAQRTDRIELEMPPYRTRMFRTEYA
jgi:hypothetical protein